LQYEGDVMNYNEADIPPFLPFEQVVQGYAPVVAEFKPKHTAKLFANVTHKAVATKDGYKPDEPKRVEPFKLYTYGELLTMEYPEDDYIVKDLIQPGLNLFVSDPKAGKTVKVMSICVHVSYGLKYWGRPTKHGRCLYLALEDSVKRAGKRLHLMKPDKVVNWNTIPFTVTLQAERVNNGLEEQIKLYMETYPDTIVIAVDVMADVEDMTVDTKGLTSYQADRKKMQPWRELVNKYPNVAFILIHHTRKQDGTSDVHKISGSQGIASSVDSLVIITQDKKNNENFNVEVKARDMFTDEEYPTAFVMKRGTRNRREWVYEGEVQEEQEQRRETEENTLQGKMNAWCKELFDSRGWVVCKEFDRLAFAEGYTQKTQLQRAREKSGIVCNKSKKYYYIRGYEPTEYDISLWKQEQLMQSTLDDNPFTNTGNET